MLHPTRVKGHSCTSRLVQERVGDAWCLSSIPLSPYSPTLRSPSRRLVCVSQSTLPSDCTLEFSPKLPRSSMAWVTHAGFSGAVLYSKPYFLHAMEGSPTMVEGMYKKLLGDPRHRNVGLLLNTSSCEQLYPHTEVSFVNIHDPVTPCTASPLLLTLMMELSCTFPLVIPYLPSPAATLLLEGKDPKQQPPQTLMAFMAFIHIVEFDAIVRRLALGTALANLISTFVNTCTQFIRESGGEIIKVANGSCLAHWPQQRAATALSSMQKLVREFRRMNESEPSDCPLALLHICIGVHCGPALLCQVGTEKADFTLLGDNVNVCARVSTLALKLGEEMLVTVPVALALGKHLPMQLEEIGAQRLRGRGKAIECYVVWGPQLDLATLRLKIATFTFPNPQLIHQICPSGVGDKGKDIDPPVPSITINGDIPSKQDVLVTSAPAGDSDTLFRLSYISHAALGIGMSHLSDVQEAAIQPNTLRGITSHLIDADGVILQTLEGPKAAVLQCWRNIQGDARHSDAVVVRCCSIETRLCLSPFEVEVITPDMIPHLPPVADILSQIARAMSCSETFVPHAITDLIRTGMPPDKLRLQKMQATVLVTDICNFTTLCEECPLEGVWQLCDTFASCCVEAVGAQGGEVVKFVGDCTIACFQPDAYAAAVQTGQSIVQKCAQVREMYRRSADCRAVLFCGVGIDSGNVMMTQSPSSGATDVAFIGEPVSRALKVESLSRSTNHSIVVTEVVAQNLPRDLFPMVRLPAFEEMYGIPIYGLEGPEWQLLTQTIRSQVESLRGTPTCTAADTLVNFSTISSTLPFGSDDALNALFSRGRQSDGTEEHFISYNGSGVGIPHMRDSVPEQGAQSPSGSPLVLNQLPGDVKRRCRLQWMRKLFFCL